MPKAVAITHVAFENLGTLEAELIEADYSIEVVDACTSEISRIEEIAPDLLIVLGGPIGVYERDAYPFVQSEVELIRGRLERKQATLGICLGAQLIAAASGAAVYPGSRGKEIGWGPLKAGPDLSLYPELRGLFETGVNVLHWHGDTFDLPASALHLAATDLYPNQAFTIEDHVLALQFHPEVTAEGLLPWYVGHSCELAYAKVPVRTLREQSEASSAKLEHAARGLWRGWLARLSDTPRMRSVSDPLSIETPQ
jgi:GMP synthase (glutamine-hydrolysing)